MGTTFDQSGSHPVILQAVAFWSAQATVIVVVLLNQGFPFFFLPILHLSHLCRQLWFRFPLQNFAFINRSLRILPFPAWQ